ncbi:transposable element Tcb1 transposase [Trichonephila clavipes]|nr:transposable element Tcb1 transposase [Trichonephila clavipes]
MCNSGLGMRVFLKDKFGLAITFVLKCCACPYRVEFFSSNFHEGTQIATINNMLVYALRSIGRGVEAGRMFRGIMNLPQPPTRSNHWEKLEEGRSVTSVAAEFGIAHSIVSRLWRQFQTTGTAIRGFSSGRPRGTTPADDRYIVLQARRNRRQTAGEIARHTTHRRLDDRYRILPCPEDCTVVVCLHDALYGVYL